MNHKEFRELRVCIKTGLHLSIISLNSEKEDLEKEGAHPTVAPSYMSWAKHILPQISSCHDEDK